MVLLAVDWSGVSLRWSRKTLLFGTVSGRRLVQGLCLLVLLMELLSRQQAEQNWFEPDPTAQFDDLLEALGLYKDISTEYGLNQTVHHHWRFGDPHKKSGEPDRHDYEIKMVNEVRSPKTEVKLRFQIVWRNPFARNEVRSPKTEVKL